MDAKLVRTDVDAAVLCFIGDNEPGVSTDSVYEFFPNSQVRPGAGDVRRALDRLARADVIINGVDGWDLTGKGEEAYAHATVQGGLGRLAELLTGVGADARVELLDDHGVRVLAWGRLTEGYLLLVTSPNEPPKLLGTTLVTDEPLTLLEVVRYWQACERS